LGEGGEGVKEGDYLGPALATLSRVPPLNTIEDPPNPRLGRAVEKEISQNKLEINMGEDYAKGATGIKLEKGQQMLE